MLVTEKMGFSEADFAKKLQLVKLLVVGDVMLDRYWFGEVSRISPEAPVPVAKIERVDERPGGAANVARNIASLGANATLLSVTGADEAGFALNELMNSAFVQSRLKQDSSIQTTVKLRVLAKQQQLIRLDFESPPSHEVLAALLDDYQHILQQYNLIILSDYGKGGLTHVTEMIKLARQCNKPVLIDPKGNDYRIYKGATLLTPNRQELMQVVGSWSTEAELAQKAHSLRESLDLDALLLTRSEDGMTLFSREPVEGVYTLTEPTRAQEVYDVSGAGDTVIASLGVGMAAGFSLSQAMRLANDAAGVVVGKVGTATCSQKELFSLAGR